MELVFVCPETHKVFFSRNFEITDNRGIQTDGAGHKSLKAKVVLQEPCPFCGEQHVYEASELSCPLTACDNSKK